MSPNSKHRLMGILLVFIPMTLACGTLDLARDMLGRLPTITPDSSSEEHFIYYVSPDGDDGNSCLDWIRACQTIMGAIAKSSGGDTIQIAAGTYLEEADPWRAVYISQDLTLLGDGADSTIIDGGGTRTGIMLHGEATVRIVGITVQNGGGTVPGHGIALEGESNLTLVDSNIRNSGLLGLHVWSDTSATLENVNIYGSPGSGIYNGGTLSFTDGSVNENDIYGIVNQGDLTMDDVEVADNPGGGINLSGGTANLVNLTILRNGFDAGYKYGLYIDNAVANIHNSRLADNDHGIRLIGASSTLTLDNVTIEGSNGTGVSINDGSATLTHALIRDNGILYNFGSYATGLTIVNGTVNIGDSQVSNNYNGGISNRGGVLMAHAIYVSNNTGRMAGLANSVDSTAVISDSAFIGHEGEDVDVSGVENRGTMTIINSTVSGNDPIGVAAFDGQLTMSYTTIAENADVGLAMFEGAATVRSVENVIVANNPYYDCSLSTAVSIVEPAYGGYNVDTDGTCRFGVTVDPADLHLGALVSSGSARGTYYPLEIGSPAIDAASGFCPGADQTGATRPFNSVCDSGAIEFDPTRSAATTSLEGSEVPEITPQGAAEIIDDTLCWTGPGAPYDVVSSLLAGVEIKIIGLGEISGWWIAEHPEFSNIACWIPEGDVDVDPSLDPAQLRLYAVPPLPTPTLPAGCLYQGPNDNAPTCYPIDQCPVNFQDSLGACTP